MHQPTLHPPNPTTHQGLKASDGRYLLMDGQAVLTRPPLCVVLWSPSMHVGWAGGQRRDGGGTQQGHW